MLAAVWTCYAIVYIWCDITVEDQQKKTIEAGMTYHLSKPIDPSLLYHVLSTYLVQIHRTKFLHQKCSFVFPSTNIPINWGEKIQIIKEITKKGKQHKIF